MQEQNAAIYTKSKKCSLKCIFAHLLILLFLVVGFAYFAWQDHQNKQQVAIQAQQIQQIKQIQQSYLEQVSTTKVESSIPSWDLLEVQYLIRLADIQLTITSNIQQSIQLLTLADQHLATLIVNDLSLVTVRQALADNIGSLKMVPAVDQVGIILKIDALSDEITKLPIPSLPDKLTKESQPKSSTPATKIPQTSWQKFKTVTWKQLQNIVIVKHHEQSIIPILSEEQQADLIQRIQFALNQTEWAVLHKQSAVYQSSLQKVIFLTNRYFSNNPAVANNIIETVKELQAINLTPKIPDISASLQAIDNAINRASGKTAS